MMKEIEARNVTVDASSLSWGARRALTYTILTNRKAGITQGLYSFFQELSSQEPDGLNLTMDLFYNLGGADAYPPLQPGMLQNFLSTFTPGDLNDGRLQEWKGQRRIPPDMQMAVRMPKGGSEMVIPPGQIIDVFPGMYFRVETGGTLQTWTNGTVYQCTGGCGKREPEWKERMLNGSMKSFTLNPDAEFLEIHFEDSVRVIFRADFEHDFVLYTPNNEEWIAQKRQFMPDEDINAEAWARLPPAPMNNGVRECEKDREYEGQTPDKDQKYCKTPTILELRPWQKDIDLFMEDPWPLRPLATVWDFTYWLYEHQAARTGQVWVG